MKSFSCLLVIVMACGSSNSGGGQAGVDGGPGSGSGSAASCTYPPNSQGQTACNELKNAMAQQISDFNSECQSVSGTSGTGTCPSAGLVGCCTTVVANFGTTESCYYSGDATDLGSSCTEQGGTFSTTP